MILALEWNLGTSRSDVNGKSQVEALWRRKYRSGTQGRGGSVRSSEEVSVMEMERRD
ncbi:MAG: hypothetical protein V3U87_06925 [Methylococcaceae bacterium]